MIFKRPKTTNNFSFYFWPIGWDDFNDNESKEEDFDLIWNEILEDPIYFWILAQILEHYTEGNDEAFSLGDLWEAKGYIKASENYDKQLWNDQSLWDVLPYQDSYGLLLYRISYLTRVFFAFDIKRLFINGYPDEIAKDFLKSYFSGWSSHSINEDDCEYIYHFLWELWKIDNYLSWRRAMKLMRPRDFEEERRFSSDVNDFEIYPNPEWEFHWKEERWEKTGEFWKYMEVELEYNKENTKKLQKFIHGYITENFDEAYGIEDITRKFIALAKRSEIIGNAVFIKLEDVVKVDFPCLQYIYWLQKTEGCLVRSWKIKDAFMIYLFDPTICHILGIWEWSQQQEKIEKLAYNEQKEVLELNEKKLSIWPNNEGFIKEYFDLMFDYDKGVAIDEIVERLEPNIADLKTNEIFKAKKRLSYDRTNLLNKRIAKLTGISGLFKIENGYIKLTSPIRVEKSSKTLEK